MLNSVTRRIDNIVQPNGGYLNPNDFEAISKNYDNEEVNQKLENIHSSLVGTAVDYLTRFMLGVSKDEVFHTPMYGSMKVDEYDYALKLLENVNGLDSKSITCVCKLAGFDVCMRAGKESYKDVKTINPDDNTINNIKIMVERGVQLFKEYGPVIKTGLIYVDKTSKYIYTGDIDYITNDTLLDFKVSVNSKINSKQTLQVLIYYIMGLHSQNECFKNIKNLGIYNPRLNILYIKSIDSISQEIIETVSNDVIGYNNKVNLNKVDNINQYENLLTTTDVMKILECSRYMVMKYYTEAGLPLFKKGDKYYIKKETLYNWLEEMEQLRKRHRRNMTIFVLLPLCLIIIFCMFIIFNNS